MDAARNKLVAEWRAAKAALGRHYVEWRVPDWDAIREWEREYNVLSERVDAAMAALKAYHRTGK